MQKIKHLLKLALEIILFIPATTLVGIIIITTGLLSVLDAFYDDD